MFDTENPAGSDPDDLQEEDITRARVPKKSPRARGA